MTDIVIVTYNAKDKLAMCLRSIAKHTKETPYRLILVDNNSQDGTAEFLKKNYQGKAVLIFNKKNLGFCGAANKALRMSTSRWIALLDDDVTVTQDWLSRLLRHLKSSKKVGIVGCKIVFPNGRIGSSGFKLNPYGMIANNEIDRGQRDYVRETDALIGPCWVIRRELLQKAGYFDEQFFPSQFEDIDYCIRIRLAGYKIIYDGIVTVIHHHLYRSGTANDLSENRKRFIRKWQRTLKNFKSAHHSPGDKLIAEGTALVGKEKFWIRRGLWKKITMAHNQVPECAYKAVALLARKRKKEALEEFKKVSVYIAENTKDVNLEIINLCRFLCVYYRRMGLNKEAAREEKRIIRGLGTVRQLLIEASRPK